MAHFGLPYPPHAPPPHPHPHPHPPMPPDQPFCMPSPYHHHPDPRLTPNPPMLTPPAADPWMMEPGGGEGGGGKFQLKRRRRCGQCGPCQVKDNCNQCQYCLRKDVLKQACVLRKCVYLRKPGPHSRPPEHPTLTKLEGGERGREDRGRSSSCSSSSGGGGGGGNPESSPHKPPSSTPSIIHTPSSSMSGGHSAGVSPASAVAQSGELRSCPAGNTSTAFASYGGGVVVAGNHREAVSQTNNHHANVVQKVAATAPHNINNNNVVLPNKGVDTKAAVNCGAVSESKERSREAENAQPVSVSSKEVSGCNGRPPLNKPLPDANVKSKALGDSASFVNGGASVNKAFSENASVANGGHVSKGFSDSATSANGVPMKETFSHGVNGVAVNAAFSESSTLANSVPLNKAFADSRGLANGVLPAVNKAGGDPLRTSALEQHHNAMLGAAGALTPCRMAYMGGGDTRGTDHAGRSNPAQMLQGYTNNSCGYGLANAIPAPGCVMNKDFSLTQREQFPASVNQWGAVPYPGYSSSWHPQQYGIHPGGGYYPNALGSSCQLGVTNPATHFTPQPSFPCAVPFPHGGFAATHTSFQSAVQSTSSFYSPPMIPSTLPNFPSFTQLPSSAGPHSSYAATGHPSMYHPGSLYSSFRPSYEPQIYHVRVSTPCCPFLRPHQPLPDPSCSSDACVDAAPQGSEKTDLGECSTDRSHGPKLGECKESRLDVYWESNKSELENGGFEDKEKESECEHRIQERWSDCECSVCGLKKSVCDCSHKINLTSSYCTHIRTGLPCAGKMDNPKTSVTYRTKTDLGKQQDAQQTRVGNADKELNLLEQLMSGSAQCKAGRMDYFSTLTPLRSHECHDQDDTPLNSNIMDPTSFNAINCSSKTNSRQPVLKRLVRKRSSKCGRLQCRKLRPFARYVDKSRRLGIKMKLNQKRSRESTFCRFDQDVCLRSAAEHTNVRLSHTHCRPVCSHNCTVRHFSTDCGRRQEKPHEITAPNKMDLTCTTDHMPSIIRVENFSTTVTDGHRFLQEEDSLKEGEIVLKVSDDAKSEVCEHDRDVCVQRVDRGLGTEGASSSSIVSRLFLSNSFSEAADAKPPSELKLLELDDESDGENAR